MPQEKLKTENYFNFSGINRKSSPYITEKNEFLNLQNVDFRTLGSLSSFCGNTQYTIGSATSSITGISDFYARSRAFNYGAITYSLINTTKYQACNFTDATFPSFYTFIYPNNPTPFNFSKNVYLFGTNSWDFFIYPGGTAALQYSLPAPYQSIQSFIAQGTGGLTGNLRLYFAFVRNDGLVGPITIGYSIAVAGISNFLFRMPTLNCMVGVTTAVNGISTGSFDIAGFRVWESLDGGNNIYGWPNVLGLAQTTFEIGDLTRASYTSLDPPAEDYFGTFLYGFNNGNGASGGALWGNFNPSCLAVYNNQLFSGGFFSTPDDVWYSQIGSLEKHDNDAFFSVRANDGDIVTCLITYFTQLIIFKVNSTHALSGQDPGNFLLSEVTDQYGCLTPNAACIWEQKLWFLDKKGIAIYNGADTKIVSTKVEDYFNRMNVPVAAITAIMIHVKERFEVWTAIPIDGSDINNLIIVYDYIADAFTTRTVSNLTAINVLTKGVNKGVVYYGDVSGSIFNYGNSLIQDNGNNFTCVIKSRFISDLGHSVEKQFRRLYLDAVIPPGTTKSFAVNFYADQGVSPYLQTTMVLSDFQERLDFGIPAKDLSVELIYHDSQFLQLNGFTIEYRFQRAV